VTAKIKNKEEEGMNNLVSAGVINENRTEFPIWKTIVNGGMKGRQLVEELKHAGINISSWTRRAIESEEFPNSPNRESINVARCTIYDLGFRKEPKMKQIWGRIEEVGSFCPEDLGPHLRLDFRNQPNKDRFFVAMKKLPTSLNSHGIFYLYRKNDPRGRKELWLEICVVGDEASCSLRNEIVFIPK
jgi:hypothetical protein